MLGNTSVSSAWIGVWDKENGEYVDSGVHGRAQMQASLYEDKFIF